MDLFVDKNGKVFSDDDIVNVLRGLGADCCKYLFVHTDIMFGRILVKRREYLQYLAGVLFNIYKMGGGGTLIFPSFTYSFNNREDYDVRNSKTSMGALIEYIRQQPGVVRTMDPLLSMILVGKNPHLLDGDLGQHSLGSGSAFDKLHHTEGVSFLFFGAQFEEYFTYVHYVEKMLNVPYRFDIGFSGRIIDYYGKVREDIHYIHTQCGGVKLKNYSEMKQELIRSGKLKVAPLGDLEVALISEPDAYEAISSHIKNSPYGFAEPFVERDLTHEYTFGKNGERVTHC